MRYLFIVSLYFICTNTFAQIGTVRGTVFDDETGESLVGVSVFIVGTTKGAMTDLDGKFSIDIETGTYNIQLSYVSYQTKLIEGVEIKDSEVTLFNNLRLKESTLELDEVVVSAKVVKRTENALQTIKRKSPVILDGISSSKMQLIGDATAVEAAKRVTGVSIEGGKYVYVRGLGDRYSKTTMNRVDIPGLDPDRNTLQMDIFPTSLISNMMVSKNFTADQPADFTGGSMNIETKDFPEEKIFSIAVSSSYNPEMHFNQDFLTYNGGKTDYFGFDDGTRGLPEGADKSTIPTPISNFSSEDVNAFIKSFNPELGTSRSKSFMDYGFSISSGNIYDLGKKEENGVKRNRKLGYIFSLSYKSDYKFYTEYYNGEFQRYTDPDNYGLRYSTIQTGELGERNILLGAIGGVAFKTNYSKVRLTMMHLQNGESRSGKFNIDNNGEAIGQSGYIALSDNLEYNQRSLSNILLNGNHNFHESGWEIDWRISPTFSTSYDPDIRKTAYTQTMIDTLFVAGAGGNPSRIWRNLNEFNTTAKIDFIKKYQLFGEGSKLKFGLSHTYKNRGYEILFFDIQFNYTQSWQSTDPNNVLNDENLYPNRPNGIYYQSGNNTPNPNEYQSNIQNTGAYISNEFFITSGLKTVLGVRVENFVQRHTGRDQSYANGDIQNGLNLDNEKVLESLRFFPSLNIIYSITENQNLRTSFTQTVARPSFKELSFAQIIDPITNRIFNGSFFNYPDWDGNLKETTIDNFDFRWEMYLTNGQIFSVSTFYKKFDNPIELVRIPEQQTSTEYQPRNVGDGLLYGVEFEIRKDFDFLSQSLKGLNFSSNVTLVESRIDMTDAEYGSRKNYEKIGETVDRNRQMAGQSPYVINAGLSYSSLDKGIETGVFYNVKGSTLTIVGIGLFPDIYVNPFHSLNYTFSKTFGKNQNSSIDLQISNILNAKVESNYKSYNAKEEVFNSYNPGRSIGLGLKYKFN